MRCAQEGVRGGRFIHCDNVRTASREYASPRVVPCQTVPSPRCLPPRRQRRRLMSNICSPHTKSWQKSRFRSPSAVAGGSSWRNMEELREGNLQPTGSAQEGMFSLFSNEWSNGTGTTPSSVAGAWRAAIANRVQEAWAAGYNMSAGMSAGMKARCASARQEYTCRRYVASAFTVRGRLGTLRVIRDIWRQGTQRVHGIKVRR